MKIFNMPQMSEQWFDIKRGKVGASSMGKVLAKGQHGGTSQGRKSYLLKLAAEVLTGKTMKGYTDKNLANGIELEPEACGEYEDITNTEVEHVGWVEQDNGKIGCSPDGMVNEGLIEIKCVIPTTQIQYCTMPDKWTPPNYKPQMQAQMWVCEKPWCDFVSYCPEIKSRKYILIKRVYRDEEYIKTIELETKKFLKELDILIGIMRHDV